MRSFTPALGSHCIRCWVAEEEETEEGETARQRRGWGSQVLPQAARHAAKAVRCKPDTVWNSLPRHRVWLVACMLCAALSLRSICVRCSIAARETLTFVIMGIA